MDLSALSSTLPPGLADAERDMGDKFRGERTTVSTTYLYRHRHEVVGKRIADDAQLPH
jgi:hypothetical protein